MCSGRFFVPSRLVGAKDGSETPPITLSRRDQNERSAFGITSVQYVVAIAASSSIFYNTNVGGVSRFSMKPAKLRSPASG
jgi:hypothetical protein